MRTASTLGAVVLVLTVAGGCSAGDAGQPEPADPSFEGTFDVVYAATNPDGTPKPDGQRKETWVSKSLCRERDCVAEVAVLDPSKPDSPVIGTRTFDFVDGRWQHTLTELGKCKAPEGEVDVDNWSVISLKPQTDDTFAGFNRWASSPRLCPGEQSVTVTRAAKPDDRTVVSDPADTPAYVKSPAEALHGTYRYLQTFDGKTLEPQVYEGATHCLRDGQRCMTYMTQPGTDKLLVMMFEDGTWVSNAPSSETGCTGGAGKARMEAYDEFPLPEPLQDPITLLAGKTKQTYVGDCPGAAETDVKLERVGD
jgi:hypothetical protein